MPGFIPGSFKGLLGRPIKCRPVLATGESAGGENVELNDLRVGGGVGCGVASRALAKSRSTLAQLKPSPHILNGASVESSYIVISLK